MGTFGATGVNLVQASTGITNSDPCVWRWVWLTTRAARERATKDTFLEWRFHSPSPERAFAMKPEDIPATLENIQALRQYSEVLSARLFAAEVITDALLATLAMSVPQAVPGFRENLSLLADAKERELSETFQKEFRGHIRNAHRRVESLK